MNDLEAQDKQLRALEAEQRRDAEIERLRDGFKAMDARIIAQLEDDRLATFQADYSPTSPQFIRANQEWQRRLIVRQVRQDTSPIEMPCPVRPKIPRRFCGLPGASAGRARERVSDTSTGAPQMPDARCHCEAFFPILRAKGQIAPVPRL